MTGIALQADYTHYWEPVLNSFLANGDLASTEDLCQQFGPRSGPIECWSWSESEQYDTLVVFMKVLFEKLILKKVRQQQKHEKLPSMQRVKF